ncbi:MAG: hypothetical protein AAF402_03295 [Pseudomonadota bacterium]
MAILLWVLGLLLAKLDMKVYAVAAYILAICVGMFSSFIGFREIRLSFKHPVRDQVALLQQNKMFISRIQDELLNFETADLDGVLDHLSIKRERLKKRMTWIYGPVQNLGFLPAIAAVGVAILEVYKATGPIILSPIVTGLALGFMLALAMFRKILDLVRVVGRGAKQCDQRTTIKIAVCGLHEQTFNRFTLGIATSPSKPGPASPQTL